MRTWPDSTSPGFTAMPPSGAEIACPAEFCRADGVFLTYETRWGSTQILADIAYETAQDDSVYMFVKDGAERTEAADLLSASGVNMDHVRFIFYPQLSENCIWVRDYGPVYIYEDGGKAVVDFWYPFTADDDVPQTVGAEFELPVYENDLLFSGGNFMTDGNGMGFATSIVYSYNTNYTEAQVRQLFADYCGLDSLVVLPTLDVENTKHIDVFCKLVNDTTFLVGEYESPGDGGGSNYYILNDIAAQLDTLRNLDGREFRVERMPMPPYEDPGGWAPTRTYVNSLILNHKILVPTYELESDAEALAIYAGLFPGYEAVPIDARQIIERAGAVHCITKLHHSDNPLVVFHEPLDSLSYGEAPAIAFTLNPRFDDTNAAVFYRPLGAGVFTEVPAVRAHGTWQAGLPPMETDFDYYLAATATSGGTDFPVSDPRTAPADYFTVLVDAPAALPLALSPGTGLHNRPNPFRTTTEIRFSVPTAAAGRLVIYDIQGKRVRDFGSIRRGPQVLSWDGTDNARRPVAAGIYFCRLVAGSECWTTRLLLWR